MNRHDLVYLNSAGKSRLLLELDALELDIDFLKTHIESNNEYKPIPLIVKQQTKKHTTGVETGISFPVIDGNVRRRRAVFTPFSSIEEVVTPYEVFQRHFNMLSAEKKDFLITLSELAEILGGQIGVFGSTALYMVSNRGYMHEKSDLDFIVKGVRTEFLDRFLKEYSSLVLQVAFPIDGELLLCEKGSVKLSEVLMPNKTILVKGFYSSFLIERKEIY